MVIRYKIVSTSFLGPFQSSKSITELLDLSLREIDARVNQALEIDKESLETFVRIRTLIGEALLRTDESSRSRTSSLSSAASLGSRIADYDKEFLYTYRWGLSRWTNHQESKADFQK